MNSLYCADVPLRSCSLTHVNERRRWQAKVHVCVIVRDPNEIKRSVSHISWFPEGPRKLAIAYSCLEFQTKAQTSRGFNIESYIWDIGNIMNLMFVFYFIVLLQATFIILTFGMLLWHYLTHCVSWKGRHQSHGSNFIEPIFKIFLDSRFSTKSAKKLLFKNFFIIS